jgi:glucose/arabinose dehydrogenase
MLFACRFGAAATEGRKRGTEDGPGMRWLVACLALSLVAGCLAGEDTAPAPTKTARAGGTTSATPATPTGTSPAKGTFTLTPFLSGLESPVYLTHAGDGSDRLFVVEQAGKIRIVKAGILQPVPFLDITSLVLTGGERGLLSVAFEPDYEKNGRFYVDYTRSTTKPNMAAESVVARYRVSANPDVADPASAEIVLTFDQPQNNHNGGLLKFGPDGMLYIGSGDGGQADDIGTGHAPEGNGQDLTTFLGKLLRINVSAEKGYTVPSDNPSLGANAKREIWAYGLRNPWRFSFDRATGDLFIGDVGQNLWEEVDHQPRASKGGENYGWPVWEGTHLHRPGTAVVGDAKPVAEYSIADENCSVTGGYVYRGAKIPSLAGYYILGDYCTGNLWTLAKLGSTWSLSPLQDTQLRPSSFGEDEAGELYLVHHGGTVSRFDPVAG